MNKRTHVSLIRNNVLKIHFLNPTLLKWSNIIALGTQQANPWGPVMHRPSVGRLKIIRAEIISYRQMLCCEEQPFNTFPRNSSRLWSSGKRNDSVLRKPQLVKGISRYYKHFLFCYENNSTVSTPRSGCTWGRIHFTPHFLSPKGQRSMHMSWVKAKKWAMKSHFTPKC